ncbi:MAG: SpoIIE family protein phosphatase, partial [Bacteroidia bacterium]|nr:SpoIIE family protein phosphatase [Bacteroidia bacterium]
YNYLDIAVRIRKITDPSKILKFVLPRIENFLRHDANNESAHFGMDFSVCSLDIKSNTLKFSGFGNPLYYIHECELKSIKGIPSILNFRQARKDINTCEIKMNEGDSFFIFSDGYADQAGQDNRKFMPRRFRELLLKIRDMQSYEQCEVLNRTIEEWRRSTDIHQVQTDDILVIGVKI